MTKTNPSTSRRAHVIGTGLVGGSIGLGLRRRGWWVSGSDAHPDTARRAQQLGALDEVVAGPGPRAVAGGQPAADEAHASPPTVTFVATPAGEVVNAARAGLAAGGVVTDVAGVKGPIVAALGDDGRFVGGHPMAGSEQDGVEGADPELFVGATWVLTPTANTDPDAYAAVQGVAASLGANVVAVPAERHDTLVALVSHVPHLTAASLMNLAADAATEDATLLRLAAGGFRDMTRIAAGRPGIWPDVVAENRQGITDTIDRLIGALTAIRQVVTSGDREELLRVLHRAREARVTLPTGAPPPDQAAEVRVPVPDRPGVIAEVFTLLGELGINIFDVEIAHSVEGDRGVLVFVVDAAAGPVVRKALTERAYHPAVRPLEI
jgi:prephenate dehydrogenase